MRSVLAMRQAVVALTTCVLMAIAFNACAQDIEPRAYSNAPVGVNFLIASYAYTQGGLPSDPALPITNGDLKTSSAILGYARALGLRGKSGTFQVVVPYTWLSGSADFAGKTVQRVVNGSADPLFRLSINLYGAPALRLKDFVDYKQDWIVGAGVRVSAPLGQNDESRVVNIGANRWSIRPELGVSKALGQWTLETSAGATLYTGNKDFFGGQTVRSVRSTRARPMPSTASPRAFGGLLTPPTSPAAGRHSMAHGAMTSSGIGAWALRWRFQWTCTTPSSFTPAGACPRAPETIST
jgi:hypothetical protein